MGKEAKKGKAEDERGAAKARVRKEPEVEPVKAEARVRKSEAEAKVRKKVEGEKSKADVRQRKKVEDEKSKADVRQRKKVEDERAERAAKAKKRQRREREAEAERARTLSLKRKEREAVEQEGGEERKAQQVKKGSGKPRRQILETPSDSEEGGLSPELLAGGAGSRSLPVYASPDKLRYLCVCVCVCACFSERLFLSVLAVSRWTWRT